MGTPANPAIAYSNSQDNLQVLKQLYSDDAWVMKDLVFNKNRFLSMVDKDETEMGLGGLNFPIPVSMTSVVGEVQTLVLLKLIKLHLQLLLSY